MNQHTLDAFTRLNDILDIVRKECPWDRVQTIQSLRYLTIEETYELSEAILGLEQDNPKADAEMKKELGDLFMHLLFYAKLAAEEGRFDTADVFEAISNKLIERHPFIFSKDEYHGESWEQLKMHEGRKSVLDGVPASLPPLVKSVRLQEKAAGIGYKDIEAPKELTEDMNAEQFGDLLFSLVHWAHDHGINADDALAAANVRFQAQVRNYEERKRENAENRAN